MNDKDLEKLIFGMAHQIRNPSAIIRSNANLLLKSQDLPTEMRRSLEAIINGVKYLEDRLDEFVEFSKPIVLNSKQIPIYKILDQVIQMVKEKCRIQKTAISSNADKSLTLVVDQQKILLALINVVLNAIESINEGGAIAISSYELDGKVLIKVEDNGCGIHSRDLPEVFSPFYSTKKGGIGIGLSISKRLIDAHKGKIEVSSQQGSGTTVTIQLPK